MSAESAHSAEHPFDPNVLLWRLHKVEELKQSSKERLDVLEPKVTVMEEWKNTTSTRNDRLEEKIDGIHRLLLGTMGGLIMSLILLIANLVVNHNSSSVSQPRQSVQQEDKSQR